MADSILTGNNALESTFHAERFTGTSLPFNLTTQGGHMTMYQSDYTSKMDPAAGGTGHDAYAEVNNCAITDMRYWTRNKEGCVFNNCDIVSVEMIQCRTANMEFSDCRIMRLRLHPQGLHGSGMKFRNCTFAMTTRPSIKGYPSSNPVAIKSRSQLLANVDVTMFGPANPWDRYVETIPQTTGEVAAEFLGYGKQADEMTTYVYPHLFVDRITGKDYSNYFSGHRDYGKQMRKTNQRFFKVRVSSSDRSKLIVDGEKKAVKIGDFIGGLFEKDEQRATIVGLREEGGSWVYSGATGNNVVEIRISKPADAFYVDHEGPHSVFATSLPPAIGDHNEPLDSNLMVHSTQALYRLPSSSFVPSTSSLSDEDQKLKEDIGAVFESEAKTATFNDTEAIRLPFHHEYTHTTIEKLEQWAKDLPRVYVAQMEFESCAMASMIFINMDFGAGCLFRNCRMENCWFIDCSFEGCAFLKTTIIDCPGLSFRYATVEGGRVECGIVYNDGVLDFTHATITQLPKLSAPDFVVDLKEAGMLPEQIEAEWTIPDDVRAVINAPAAEVSLSRADFHDASTLPFRIFKGKKFEECDFNNYKFDQSQITGTDFLNCALNRALFREGFIRGSEWHGCEVSHTAFRTCEVTDTLFRECSFYDSDLCFHSGVRMLRCAMEDVTFEQYDASTNDIQRFEMELCRLSAPTKEPVSVLSFKHARIARSFLRTSPNFYFFLNRSSLRDTHLVMGKSQEEIDGAIADALSLADRSIGVMLYNGCADLTNARVDGFVHCQPNLHKSDDLDREMKVFVSRATNIQGMGLYGDVRFVTLADAYSTFEGASEGEDDLEAKVLAFPLDGETTSMLLFLSDEDAQRCKNQRICLLQEGLERGIDFEFAGERMVRDEAAGVPASLDSNVHRITVGGGATLPLDLWKTGNFEQGSVTGRILYNDDQSLYVLAMGGVPQSGAACTIVTAKRSVRVEFDRADLANSTLYLRSSSDAAYFDPEGGRLVAVIAGRLRTFDFEAVDPGRRKITGLVEVGMISAETAPLRGEADREDEVWEIQRATMELTIASSAVYDYRDFYTVPAVVDGAWTVHRMNRIASADASYLNMNMKAETDPAATHMMRVEENGEETVNDYTMRFDVEEQSLRVGRSVKEWALTTGGALESEVSIPQYAVRTLRATQKYLYATCYAKMRRIREGIVVGSEDAGKPTLTISDVGSARDLLNVDDVVMVRVKETDAAIAKVQFSSSGTIPHATLSQTRMRLRLEKEISPLPQEGDAVTLLPGGQSCTIELVLSYHEIVVRSDSAIVEDGDGAAEEVQIASQRISVAGRSRALYNRFAQTTGEIRKGTSVGKVSVGEGSAAAFPPSGYFFIGVDHFSYSSRDDSAFYGVERKQEEKHILPAGSPVTMIAWPQSNFSVATNQYSVELEGTSRFTDAWSGEAGDSAASQSSGTALPRLGRHAALSEDESLTFEPSTLAATEHRLHVFHRMAPLGAQLEPGQQISVKYSSVAAGDPDRKSYIVESSRAVRSTVIVAKGSSPLNEDDSTIDLFGEDFLRDFESSGGTAQIVYAEQSFLCDYAGVGPDGLTGVTVQGGQTMPIVPDGVAAHAYPLHGSKNARLVEIVMDTKARANLTFATASSVTYEKVAGLGRIVATSEASVSVDVSGMDRYMDASSQGPSMEVSLYLAMPAMTKFALLGLGGPQTRARSFLARRIFQSSGLPTVERVGNAYRITVKSNHGGKINPFDAMPTLTGRSRTGCVLLPGYGTNAAQMHMKEMTSILDLVAEPALRLEGLLLSGASFCESLRSFQLGSDRCPIGEALSFPDGEILPPSVTASTGRALTDRKFVVRAFHDSISLSSRADTFSMRIVGASVAIRDVTGWRSGDAFPNSAETVGERRSRFDTAMPSITSDLQRLSAVTLRKEKGGAMRVMGALEINATASSSSVSGRNTRWEVAGNVFEFQHFESCWLEHAIFSGCTFRNCVFSVLCNLTGADFSNCVFEQCRMHLGPYTLGGIDFRGAKLRGTIIDATVGTGEFSNMRFDGVSIDARSELRPAESFVRLWGSSKVPSLPPQTTQTLNMAYFRMGEAANMQGTDLSGVNLVGRNFYMGDFSSAYMAGAYIDPADMGLAIMTPQTTIPKTVTRSTAMTFSSGRARNSQLVDSVQRSDLRGSNLTAAPITQGARFNFSIYDSDTQFPSYIDPKMHIPGAINVDAAKLAFADITGLKMRDFHGLKDETVLARAERVLEADGSVAKFHRISSGLEFDDGRDPIRQGYSEQRRRSGVFMRALALADASDEDKERLQKQYRSLCKKLARSAKLNTSAPSCDADIVDHVERISRIYVTSFTGSNVNDEDFLESVRRMKLSGVEMRGRFTSNDILGKTAKDVESEVLLGDADLGEDGAMFHFLRPTHSRLLRRDESGQFHEIIKYVERGEACERGGDPRTNPNFRNKLFNRNLTLDPDPWAVQSTNYRGMRGKFSIQTSNYDGYPTTPIWYGTSKKRPGLIHQWPLCCENAPINDEKYEEHIGAGLPGWMTDNKPDVAVRESKVSQIAKHVLSSTILVAATGTGVALIPGVAKAILSIREGTSTMGSDRSADDEKIKTIMRENGMDETKFTRTLRAMKGTFLDQRLPVQSVEQFSSSGGFFCLRDFSSYIYYAGKDEATSSLLGVCSYDPDLVIRKYDFIFLTTIIDPVPDDTSANKGGMFPGCLPNLASLQYELTMDMVPPDFENDRDLWLEATIPAYYYTKEDMDELLLRYRKNTFGAGYPESDDGGYHTVLFDKNPNDWSEGLYWGVWNSDDWRDTFTGINDPYFKPLEARYCRIRVRKRIGLARRNTRRIDRGQVTDYYANLGGLRVNNPIYDFELRSAPALYKTDTKGFKVGDVLAIRGRNDFLFRVTELVRYKVYREGREGSRRTGIWTGKYSTEGIIKSVEVLKAPDDMPNGDYVLIGITPWRRGTTYRIKNLRKIKTAYPDFIYSNSALEAYSSQRSDASLGRVTDSSSTSGSGREIVVRQTKAPFTADPLHKEDDNEITFQRLVRNFQRRPNELTMDRRLDLLSTCTWDIVRRHIVGRKGTENLITLYEDASSGVGMSSVNLFGDTMFPERADQRHVQNPAVMAMSEETFAAVQADGSIYACRRREKIASPAGTTFRTVVANRTGIAAVTENNAEIKLAAEISPKTAGTVTIDSNGAVKESSSSGMARPALRRVLLKNSMNRGQILQSALLWLASSSLQTEGIVLPDGKSIAGGIDDSLFDAEGKLKSDAAAKDHYQLVLDDGTILIATTEPTILVPAPIVEEWRGTTIPGYRVAVTPDGSDESTSDGWKFVKDADSREINVRTVVTQSGMPAPIVASSQSFAAVAPDTLVASGNTYTRQNGDAIVFDAVSGASRSLYSNAAVRKIVLACPSGFLVLNPDQAGVGASLHCEIDGKVVTLDDSITGSSLRTVVTSSNMFAGITETDPATIVTINGTLPATALAGDEPRHIFGADHGFVALTDGSAVAWGGAMDSFGEFTKVDSPEGATYFMMNYAFHETVVSHAGYFLMRRKDTNESYLNGKRVPGLIEAAVDMAVIRVNGHDGNEHDLAYILLTTGELIALDHHADDAAATTVKRLSTAIPKRFVELRVTGSDKLVGRTEGGEIQVINGSNVFPLRSDGLGIVEPTGLDGGLSTSVGVEFKEIGDSSLTVKLTDGRLPSNVPKGSTIRLMAADQTIDAECMINASKGDREIVLRLNEKAFVHGTVAEDGTAAYSLAGTPEEYDMTTESGATRDSRVAGNFGSLHLNGETGEFTYELADRRSGGVESFSILRWTSSLPTVSSIVHVANLHWGTQASESVVPYGAHTAKIVSSDGATATADAGTVDWPAKGALVALRAARSEDDDSLRIVESNSGEEMNSIYAQWAVQPYSLATYGFMRMNSSDNLIQYRRLRPWRTERSKILRKDAFANGKQTVHLTDAIAAGMPDDGIVEIASQTFKYEKLSSSSLAILGHVSQDVGAEIVYQEIVFETAQTVTAGASAMPLLATFHGEYEYSTSGKVFSGLDGADGPPEYLVEAIRCIVSEAPEKFAYTVDILGTVDSSGKIDVEGQKFDVVTSGAEDSPYAFSVGIENVASYPEPLARTIRLDTRVAMERSPKLSSILFSTEDAFRSRLSSGYSSGETVKEIVVEDASAFPEMGSLLLMGRLRSLRSPSSKAEFLVEPSLRLNGSAVQKASISTSVRNYSAFRTMLGYRESVQLFSAEGVVKNGGDGYRSAPTVEYSIGSIDAALDSMPYSVKGQNRLNAKRWQERQKERRIVAEMDGLIRLPYVAKDGNRLILSRPHTFTRAIPALMVESQVLPWKAHIVKSSASTNIRSVVTNGLGSAALLRTSRLSDVCMNCKKSGINIRAFKTKLNIFECLGHRQKAWDLSGKDLTGMVLDGTELKKASCRDASMYRVRMTGASATDCAFVRATMRQSLMRRSSFARCDFSGADLRDADLSGATFVSCNFSSACLNRIRVDAKTEFVDCTFDLSSARHVSFSQQIPAFRGSKSSFIGADFRMSTGALPALPQEEEAAAEATIYGLRSITVSSLSITDAFVSTVAARGRVMVMLPGSANVLEGRYTDRTSSKLLGVEWVRGDDAALIGSEGDCLVGVTDLKKCRIQSREYANFTFADLPNAVGPDGEDLSLTDVASLVGTVVISDFTSFQFNGRAVEMEVEVVGTTLRGSSLNTILRVGDRVRLIDTLNGKTLDTSVTEVGEHVTVDEALSDATAVVAL